MGTSLVDLFTIGLKVFSEERGRKFQRDYLELLNDLSEAKRAKFPLYSDSRVEQCQEKIDNFLKAYNKEFEGALNGLLSKVGSIVSSK